ncbi:MAG: hypothetical protein V3W09_04100 [Nitrososphaerales archaeon]
MLKASGEMKHLFYPKEPTIPQFFDSMNSAKSVLFSLDETGIWICVWTRPLLGVVTANVWIRSDRRGLRNTALQITRIFELLLSKGQTILVATPDPKTQKLIEHFGFRLRAFIENLFGKEDGFVSRLTYGPWLDRGRKGKNGQRHNCV